MSNRTPLMRMSPNQNARPKGKGPELVVIHGTAGASASGDLEWLRNPASKVSYHYLVGRTGLIYQLVPESSRAWHAGVSSWMGRKNVNDFSIGVALANRGPDPTPEPYPAEQMDAAAWLVAGILTRRGLNADRIVGHADVAPGRKHDPWAHFDWKAFRIRVIEYMHPLPPVAAKIAA